jgi:hypothetical protein
LDAVRDELTALGAGDTVEGQLALALADAVDHPRAGMATAGDAKELRAVMAALRDKTPAKVDPVDELNARRAARGSASEAG